MKIFFPSMETEGHLQNSSSLILYWPWWLKLIFSIAAFWNQFHLFRGPNVLVPSDFWNKILILISSTYSTCLAHHVLLDSISLIIFHLEDKLRITPRFSSPAKSALLCNGIVQCKFFPQEMTVSQHFYANDLRRVGLGTLQLQPPFTPYTRIPYATSLCFLNSRM
jgi:hypothetical protein